MAEKKEQFNIQVVLPQEYEDMILERFSQLAETAIEQKIEKASIQKRFIKQTQLLEHLGCGMSTLEELYKNGLHWIPLGKSKLIDLEELAEVLVAMKR